MDTRSDAGAANSHTMGKTANTSGREAAPVRGRPREWTEGRIVRELDAFLRAWSGCFFPSGRQLRRVGRGDLLAALEASGGLAQWANRVAMPLGPRQDRRPYGLADAKKDALEVINTVGALPGDHRLKKLGKVRLASYLANHTGGRRPFLRSIGFDDKDAMRLSDLGGMPRTRRWSTERVQRELTEVLAGRVEWPPDSFFVDASRTDLLAAVRRYGGKRHWAGILGLDYRRPRRSY